MYQYTPLITGMLFAFFALCVIGAVVAMVTTEWRMRRLLIRSLVSLTQLKKSLQLGVGFWLMLLTTVLIVAAIFAVLSFYWFFQILDDGLAGEATTAVLRYVQQSRWNLELTTGENYHLIPLSFLVAVSLGSVFGFALGIKLGRRLVSRRILLGSQLCYTINK